MSNNIYLTEVSTYPSCDIHMAYEQTMIEAHYDAKMRKIGTWAYMCEGCFNAYGLGLGVGLGQMLVLKEDATK